ncbi:hypothetical protein MNBD_ALPHA09-1533 [hydrothermal vent metagenome]|uniref:Na+-dependent transporter n=1 Tax=hydrothermal vent metagenome TaxID=652676 RepID=A0A3B0TK00_9ZZZZ
MTLLIALFEIIGRRAPLALVAGIAFSLLVPSLSAIAGPYLPAFVVGTLTMAIVRIDLARAAAQWRRADRIVLALVLLLVVMPVAVAFAAPAAGLPMALVVMLVLLAASPPLASGANFAFILGLDGELAVNLVLAGTLVMPFVAPPLIFYVLDLGLDVDAWEIFVRLSATVALAVICASVIRVAAGRERIVRRAAMLDGIAVIWMILFLVAIMDGVPALIGSDPGAVAVLLIVGLGANFGFSFAVLAAGLLAPQRRNVASARALATVAMFAGNRNFGLVLTALPAPLYVEIGPFVALYQIPIYLTPLVMGPLFARFIGDRAQV